jgi:hypothetical protein
MFVVFFEDMSRLDHTRYMFHPQWTPNGKDYLVAFDRDFWGEDDWGRANHVHKHKHKQKHTEYKREMELNLTCAPEGVPGKWVQMTTLPIVNQRRQGGIHPSDLEGVIDPVKRVIERILMTHTVALHQLQRLQHQLQQQEEQQQQQQQQQQQEQEQEEQQQQQQQQQQEEEPIHCVRTAGCTNGYRHRGSCSRKAPLLPPAPAPAAATAAATSAAATSVKKKVSINEDKNTVKIFDESLPEEQDNDGSPSSSPAPGALDSAGRPIHCVRTAGCTNGYRHRGSCSRKTPLLPPAPAAAAAATAAATSAAATSVKKKVLTNVDKNLRPTTYVPLLAFAPA